MGQSKTWEAAERDTGLRRRYHWPCSRVAPGRSPLSMAARMARHRVALRAVAGAALFGARLPWLVDFSAPGSVATGLSEAGLLAHAAVAAVR